ncbi:hypothetical protein AXK60_17250 [Tsukamurella pseudospumae]|uniref:Signal transduction histidine kinase subgroup 3 dimerisation and phosphoacceptor domain-containing protein n=2 Tax=Tsukamurella pseudospumae TaxID=239498 RepID=A0A137ZZE2_9ACTN|nr:hypothetical protein AXK61_12015 [Tsukamurella pseudospumae]KXP03558.1 hypothetical protein AXK60_17250 [Tsukamurella pseudospumae]
MGAMRNDQDVRDIIGMRHRGATALAWAIVATFAVLSWYARADLDPAWPQVIGIVGLLLGAMVLVRAPGDPLPWRWTLVVAAGGPVAALSVFPFLPADYAFALTTWPIGAGAVLTSYLAVRGRAITTWASVALTGAVVVWWAVTRGHGALDGVLRCLPSATVTLTATFFALTLRPVARWTFVMRARTRERRAAEAAAETAREVRGRQRDFLDREARPMLERLATGVPLTAAERLECRIVEARLRDSVRAPGLLSPRIADAADRARRRGVDVVLLDDGGLRDLATPVADAIRDRIADAVDSLPVGSVTARAVPPGRALAATVLLRAPDGATTRIELPVSA